MYIKRIRIAKYRHLENIDLGPFTRPGDGSDLIVLAGPNGGGKSSVLELVSLALSNMWSLTYALNRTQPQSSFEVTIGLLPSEVQLIREDAQTATQATFGPSREYLLNRHEYARSFNFAAGDSAQDPTLHHIMHEVVRHVLLQSFHRPLGFFLGADRSYERAQFQRNNLFNYTTYATSTHTWSYAFQTSTAQYRDMFDFLVTWRFHYMRRLGSFHHQKAAALITDASIQPPEDEYGQILAKVFPGYTFVDSAEDAPSDLHIRIPSGETISFSDLSSGEKEVFFTLCFFQRHNVKEAVIVIDEPELHLHPSLARLLIRTMQDLKPRNQIWLATQNSEVVDEAGRDKVLFVRRNENTKRGEVIKATDEEEALACLRDLFGQSGYIGLARAMLFTEGEHASTDRKMFSKLFPQATRDVKIIPAAGCGESQRINRAVLALLQSTIAWCRFYLLRDRDYLTPAHIAALRAKSGANMFVLERHEIENYLLDWDLMAKVVADIFERPTTGPQVEAHFHLCARRMAGNVLRDMVAFRLNFAFRPEDFSVPKLGQGELAYDAASGWDAGKLTLIRDGLRSRADVAVADLRGRVDGHSFDSMFDSCRREIELAFQDGSWANLFPGKELIGMYCSTSGLGKPPIFQNSVLKEMAADRARMPAELAGIIAIVGA